MGKIFNIFLVIMLVGCKTTSVVDDRGYKGKTAQVFGYNSVDHAYNELKKLPTVKSSERNGWKELHNSADHSFWAFTPDDHEAHPSIIKRSVVLKGGEFGIQTQISCAAEKSICDKLLQNFKNLNNVNFENE